MTAATTEESTGGPPVLEPWQAGVVGGIVGAILWGVYASLRTPALLEDYLPEVFGLGTGQSVLGWIVLVSLGAILGVVFVAVVEGTSLDDRLESNVTNAQAGMAYGIVTWALVTALLVPLLAGAVGTEAAPDVPLLAVEHLVGHVVYGVVLGLTYSLLVD